MRWLLEQRGYSYVLEDQLHTVVPLKANKRPDFFVDTMRGVRFLAEVKVFATPTVLDKSDEFTGAMFGADLQSKINAGPIPRAAQQLAPYTTAGFPLIVVLDNHRQMGVPLGDVYLVQIFGSLEYAFTTDQSTGEVLSEGWVHRQSDSATGHMKRPYISAVVVNQPTKRFEAFDGVVDDFTLERPMRARVIHNPDANHPLPLWVFSEPQDEQITRRGSGWVKITCPPAHVRHEDVQRRAYEIFERRGGGHGLQVEDWLNAERELQEEI